MPNVFPARASFGGGKGHVPRYAPGVVVPPTISGTTRWAEEEDEEEVPTYIPQAHTFNFEVGAEYVDPGYNATQENKGKGKNPGTGKGTQEPFHITDRRSDPVIRDLQRRTQEFMEAASAAIFQRTRDTVVN